MANAVQILDPNMGGLRKAQAASVNATEEGPSAQVAFGADSEELFDLGHAIRTRNACRTFGTLDPFENGFNIVLEQSSIESPHGVDGEADGRRGLLALGN